jgi:hypothetical protein
MYGVAQRLKMSQGSDLSLEGSLSQTERLVTKLQQQLSSLASVTIRGQAAEDASGEQAAVSHSEVATRPAIRENVVRVQQ